MQDQKISAIWNFGHAIPANCPYLMEYSYFDPPKGGKLQFYHVSLFLKNLSVVMYRKFRNIPIFQDLFIPIC